MDKERSLKTSKKRCCFGNQGALDMRNFQLAFQGPFMRQTVSQWSLRTKVRVRSKASACGTCRHTSAASRQYQSTIAACLSSLMAATGRQRNEQSTIAACLSSLVAATGRQRNEQSLTFRLLMSYIYMEHPFLMFLDHTQRRSTVGRTPLDE